MRATTVLAGLLVFAVCVGALAQDSKPPASLTKARKEYSASLKKIQEQYNDGVGLAAQEHKKKLEALLQEETKAGNLDGAIAIREDIKLLDSAPLPLISEEGDAITLKGQWVSGNWTVKYHPNKTGGSLFIRPNGDVFNIDGAKKGQLKVENDSIVLYSGERVERFSFSGNRLFIEHYLNKEDFAKNAVNQIGVGELIKKK